MSSGSDDPQPGEVGAQVGAPSTLVGVVIAGLALLAATLGEALARLPGDACAVAVRGSAVRTAGAQLLVAWSRSTAVLIAGTSTAATVLMLADPVWSWLGAVTAIAIGLLPLVVAPLTVAPLFGAPMRLGLLVWCAVRVADRLGGVSPATVAALLAGVAAAGAVGSGLGVRELGAAISQTVRDTVSAVVALPLAVAVGVVPVLIGLPVAPWELWHNCRRQPRIGPVAPGPLLGSGSGELFVVYLDGVGKTRREPTRVARELGTVLGPALAGARIVTDVMPYSPAQLPLTERPRSGPLWRWLRRHAFPMLVGHNILQTLVALDARYQQAYGHLLARAAANSLDRAGYRRGDRVAVVGYSGGAVIGLAAADPLADLLDVPRLVVLSLGGYLDGYRMPARATVHHVASSDDQLERLGRVMFPPRWPVSRNSAWNRALARGSVVRHAVTGPRHVGPRGYLAAEKDGDGTSNLSRTVAVTASLLQPEIRR